MSAATIGQPATEVVQATRIDSMITYPVSKQEIATLRAKFSGLKADTPAGYEQVRLAIGKTRELRVQVEKRRKELKADSLEFGRKVDAVARQLTNELETIEEPLALLKSEVDDAKKREKEAKEKAERDAIEADLRARHEANEARLKSEREAAEAKLAEERAKLDAERAEMAAKQQAIDEANRVEREKMEAEKAKADAEAKERQAKIDAENKRIAEEQAYKQAVIEEDNRKLEEKRNAIEAQRQAAERAEFERVTKVKAEAEAKAKIETDRIDAEKKAAEHKAWQESERLRLDAMKPDIEKVHAFAKAVRSLSCPGLKSDDARNAVRIATTQLAEIAEVLDTFQVNEIPWEAAVTLGGGR